MNLLRTNIEVYPIYWVNNFLSNDEIKKIIEYVETLPIHCGQIGRKKQKKGEGLYLPDSHIKDMNVGNVPTVRISNLRWIELNKDTNWLYKKIIKQIHKVNQENFNMILKFVENLQFSEYTENEQGFYGKHNDSGDKSKIENYVDIRKISFSIQLTDESEYKGGDLLFYKDGETIMAPKTKGAIIFFESDIYHEVKPVKEGTRLSLVSWVCGPNLR